MFLQYKGQMHNTRISHDARKKSSSKIARGEKADHIVVNSDVAINSRGPTSSLNDMTSLEPNKAAAPSGNHSKRFFEFRVYSDEGLDLCADLNTSPLELAQNYYSLFHTGSDENPLVASKGEFKIVDILENAQLKASVRNGHVKEVAMKEVIGCCVNSHVPVGAQLKTSIENEKLVEVATEDDIDCGEKLPVCRGSQLTPRREEHESPLGIEPQEEVAMEEDVGCDDKPPTCCQVATDFSIAGLTPSSFASGGMSGGSGGGNEAVVEEEVVHMEDAVKLLVEHLVRPVLPRRAGKDAYLLTLEKQRAIA